MERLTDKNKQGFEIYDEEKLEFEDYYDKLKEYEDIEENIGIDLVTLFKTLEQGYIWLKDEELGIQYCCQFHLTATGNNYYFYCEYGCIGTSYDFYNLKDCGITWALTKEGLK